MTDPTEMATGGLLGALVALGVQHFKNRAAARKAQAEEHQADATVEVAGIQAFKEMAQTALKRADAQDEKIDALRNEVQRCETERAADREEYRRQREVDRRKCDREIREVKRNLSRVAAAAAEQRSVRLGADDTGVHHLRAIASDSQPKMPAMPPPTPRGERDGRG